MKDRIAYSNCLFQATKHWIKRPVGAIGWDFNSPSGSISFYYEYDGLRYRFRRRKMKGNTGKLLFWGHAVIEII